jgi:hypothetical protein
VEGFNAFCRIFLALDLEPWLREKARLNQSAGGQNKGSSKLTEAQRVDVRSQIAAAAGVSVGNVTKVQQLITTAGLQPSRKGSRKKCARLTEKSAGAINLTRLSPLDLQRCTAIKSLSEGPRLPDLWYGLAIHRRYTLFYS